MEILNLIKMKKIILFVFITSFLIACEADNKKNNSEKNDPMSGYMVGNDEKSNAVVGLNPTEVTKGNQLVWFPLLFHLFHT